MTTEQERIRQIMEDIKQGEEQVKKTFDGLQYDPATKTFQLQADVKNSGQPIVIIPEDLGME